MIGRPLNSAGLSLKLLRIISSNGDLSVSETIRLLPKTYDDHRDLYPLANLLEAGFLGCTVNFEPPSGAENMREYNTAISLYLMAKRETGDETIKYRGIESWGNLLAEHETVFLKAKGSLFLDELQEKRRDRIVFTILGLTGGLSAVFIREAILSVFAG